MSNGRLAGSNTIEDGYRGFEMSAGTKDTFFAAKSWLANLRVDTSEPDSLRQLMGVEEMGPINLQIDPWNPWSEELVLCPVDIDDNAVDRGYFMCDSGDECVLVQNTCDFVESSDCDCDCWDCWFGGSQGRYCPRSSSSWQRHCGEKYGRCSDGSDFTESANCAIITSTVTTTSTTMTSSTTTTVDSDDFHFDDDDSGFPKIRIPTRYDDDDDTAYLTESFGMDAFGFGANAYNGDMHGMKGGGGGNTTMVVVVVVLVLLCCVGPSICVWAMAGTDACKWEHSPLNHEQKRLVRQHQRLTQQQSNGAQQSSRQGGGEEWTIYMEQRKAYRSAMYGQAAHTPAPIGFINPTFEPGGYGTDDGSADDDDEFVDGSYSFRNDAAIPGASKSAMQNPTYEEFSVPQDDDVSDDEEV